MEQDYRENSFDGFRIASIIVVFLLVWFLCAKNFSGWGDEITHFAAAKGLVETGDCRIWDFDQGRPGPLIYTRALIITYLASFSYYVAGLSLLAFRVVPLFFVLLTFLTFALYIRARHNASNKGLLCAAIFFFGHVFIFEQSMYFRIYAPLGWLMICGVILYWEALLKFQKRKIFSGVLLALMSLATLIVPTVDHWQVQHLAIFLLGILISLPKAAELIVRIEKALGFKGNVILIPVILLFSFFVVVCLDYAMGYLVIDAKQRVMGRSFVTYWDNIAGMTRYILSLNVCFIALHWTFKNLRDSKKWDFFTWLFFTGIISGILIGLLNPHNHIFYSRFFYISALMTVLGFSQMLSRASFTGKNFRIIVAIFIALNLGLLIVNAYFERCDIRVPISWLKKNLQENDLLLVFRSQLELHDGETLTSRSVIIPAGDDPESIKELLGRIEPESINNIYFLYMEEYQFREELYFLTMREDRSPPKDLYRHLKSVVPSQAVLPGLRIGQLVRFQKADLMMSLQEVSREGYPPQFKGLEKRVLKKLLKPLMKQRDI